MTQDDATTEPANDELADMKAKMREALDRKNAQAKGVPEDGPVREKAHGSEVLGGAARSPPPQGRRRRQLSR